MPTNGDRISTNGDRKLELDTSGRAESNGGGGDLSRVVMAPDRASKAMNPSTTNQRQIGSPEKSRRIEAAVPRLFTASIGSFSNAFRMLFGDKIDMEMTGIARSSDRYQPWPVKWPEMEIASRSVFHEGAAEKKSKAEKKLRKEAKKAKNSLRESGTSMVDARVVAKDADVAIRVGEEAAGEGEEVGKSDRKHIVHLEMIVVEEEGIFASFYSFNRYLLMTGCCACRKVVITEPSTMGTKKSRTGGDLEGCDSEIVQLKPVNVSGPMDLGNKMACSRGIARPISFKSVSRVHPTNIECC
ncbi:hypothetical protein WN944_005474 [Citrus x changshan-huyou]|uniref:Uncharacterized protein n=1 Tax=Citrus x changshan-huyou TaxID=2935761 RepID=A0AAP0M508_9ROSI